MPRVIILGEKLNVNNIAATLEKDAEGLVKILGLPQHAIGSSGAETTVNVGSHTITYYPGDGRIITIRGTREAAIVNYATGNGQQTLSQVLQSQGYLVPQLG